MKNSKPYQIVTENLIAAIEAAIEKGEKMPWQRPWNLNGRFRNMATKHCFTGMINLLMLHYLGEGCVRFATFKQIQSCKADLLKGAKAITLLRPVLIPVKDDKGDKGQDVIDKNGKKKLKLVNYSYYKVFADKYIKGGKFPTHEEDLKESDKIDFKPIEEAEKIVANHDLKLSHSGNQAFYNPLSDSVTMPEKETFKSNEHYYFTLFHEMGHWAISRVNQEKREANESYAFEELIAEFTSTMVGTYCNLNFEKAEFDNSVSYLQGWLSKLQSNPSWLGKAASLAEKRADYLIDPESDS
jgi:antirestriction protein ArdC